MTKILIFLLFSSFTAAQNFFPMHHGNKYQFEDLYNNNGTQGSLYQQLHVSYGDSINGLSLYRFTTYGPGYVEIFNPSLLFYYDSLLQKLFVKLPQNPLLQLAADFNTPPDSEYISYITGNPLLFKSEGTIIQNVLGSSRLTYKMMYDDPGIYNGHNYFFHFSDGIGIVGQMSNFYNSSGGRWDINSIQGAIIDSIIYDPFIVRIDTMYPLNNRKVNQFPFIMNFNYSLHPGWNPPYIVDSFYLSVQHLRSDSIIANLQYGISAWEGYVSVTVQNLQVGDTLKLKAILLDKCIFPHRSEYPPDGHAIIVIIPNVTDIEDQEEKFTFELAQNYPNPFNPSTTINYSLSERGKVRLNVYDALGSEVRKLVDEEKDAGNYEMEFNADGLSSGLYFYRLNAGKVVISKKMILLK